MNLHKSFVIAIAMYSRLPVPKVEWSKENMKYAMCFFPFVGVIIGIVVGVAGGLLYDSGCGRLFYAAVMMMIPLLINGGIHMDGLLDTIDAMSSCGNREKKLAILKDPHAGAFAILWGCSYLIMNLALWSEMTKEMLPVIGWGYVLSRALSGCSVVIWPAAKPDGLAKTFQEQADQRRSMWVLIAISVIAAIAMLWFSVSLGLVALACAGVVFMYYRLRLVREFGGVSGDLAGCFLQLCELAMLAGVVICGGVLGNWSGF